MSGEAGLAYRHGEGGGGGDRDGSNSGGGGGCGGDAQECVVLSHYLHAGPPSAILFIAAKGCVVRWFSRCTQSRTR